MKKTNYRQRQDALKEWIREAVILGMPKSVIKKTQKDFEVKDKVIRRWEEEASFFQEIGEKEESDLCSDEAHEIHIELLENLSIKKFAA
jgi:hypothetical protein